MNLGGEAEDNVFLILKDDSFIFHKCFIVVFLHREIDSVRDRD